MFCLPLGHDGTFYWKKRQHKVEHFMIAQLKKNTGKAKQEQALRDAFGSTPVFLLLASLSLEIKKKTLTQ